MSKSNILVPGHYYHIYNKGNNGENIFIEPRNYTYFLKLYAKHIEPVAFTFAYCLLRNHFHFLIRIKTDEEQQAFHETSEVLETSEVFNPRNPHQAHSNLYNAYAKSINKSYGRTGSLFANRFKRKHVNSDAYFLNLVAYIHQNPQQHQFVDDFQQWKWSSYDGLLSDGNTKLKRNQVLDWFGNKSQFIDFHQNPVDEQLLKELIFDENVTS